MSFNYNTVVYFIKKKNNYDFITAHMRAAINLNNMQSRYCFFILSRGKGIFFLLSIFFSGTTKKIYRIILKKKKNKDP